MSADREVVVQLFRPIQTVLPKAGYHAGRKTVFVWEGVSFYLPERDVTATLRFVAKNSSPGSIIVFDYESERVVNGNHDDTRLKEAITRLAKWGEPHIFGLPDGKTREFLQDRGLTVVSDFGAAELTRRYLTRKDGTVLAEEPWHFGICVARVPE
jgi:methyltransferase (TIGR00027 family)